MQVTDNNTTSLYTQDTTTVSAGTEEADIIDSTADTTGSITDTVELSPEVEELASTEDTSTSQEITDATVVTANMDSEIKLKDLKSKVKEFESLINSLEGSDVDVEATNGVLATVSGEVDQANEDYQNGTIDEETLSATLSTILDSGIDGINSLTSGVGDQTTAVTQSTVESTETTPEALVATTPEPVNEDVNTLATTTSDDEEGVNIDEMFETINKIVKIIESSSETDHMNKDIEELMEEADPLKLEEELKKAVSDSGNIDYSKFAEKLRDMQKNMTDHNKMFGEEKKNGGNISSIGTGRKDIAALESDGFTANRFMSSISSGINNALDKYKDVKEAMEEKVTKEEKQENVESVRALA